MFILDFGSGNTCKNDLSYIQKMIDRLKEVDPDRKFIIKWQLFKEAGGNIPLTKKSFEFAYMYAYKHGWQTTASVFDKESLDYLLKFPIPFVKIANRPDLYWLIGDVPRKIKVVFSNSNTPKQSLSHLDFTIDKVLQCISNYPAMLEDYSKFSDVALKEGISDHTTNWELFIKYKPKVYECHYRLEDSTGLDAGEFARTPEQLKEIYRYL